MLVHDSLAHARHVRGAHVVQPLQPLGRRAQLEHVAGAVHIHPLCELERDGEVVDGREMERARHLGRQAVPIGVGQAEPPLGDVTLDHLDAVGVQLRRSRPRSFGHPRLDERGDPEVRVLGEQPLHEPAADEAREPGEKRERHGGRAYEKSPRQLLAPRTLGVLPMRLFGLIALALALLAAPAHAAPKPKAKPAKYEVGIATRSISPDADGTFAGKPVYLGGYGIGGGSPVLAGRAATGVLGEGPSVRAFVVSDGTSTFAIADIETQGWFAATKNGPYGLIDMRKAVEEATGGAAAGRERRRAGRPQPRRRRHDRRLGRCARRVHGFHEGPDRRRDRRGVPDEAQGDALVRHGARPGPAVEPVRLRRGERGRRLRRASASGARRRRAVRDDAQLLGALDGARLGQHQDHG